MSILIVENEVDTIESLSFILEQNGIIVSSACAGNVAYTKILKEQPELFLTDVGGARWENVLSLL